jgi:hypothetical protein
MRNGVSEDPFAARAGRRRWWEPPHPAESGGAGASVAPPDLLARGAARAPSCKRRISRPLPLLLRSSTITVCPAGTPGSKAFDASGNTAHSETERRIAEAE